MKARELTLVRSLLGESGSAMRGLLLESHLHGSLHLESLFAENRLAPKRRVEEDSYTLPRPLDTLQ